jgi:hypothetical protein
MVSGKKKLKRKAEAKGLEVRPHFLSKCRWNFQDMSG